MTLLPPPTAFGLPQKFGEWRENQDVACTSILDCPTRFLVQVCPTGFGKSLTYMTAATLNEGRTVILTSTKGLQTQLIRDFGSDQVVDIRGRGNYKCRLNTHVNCDLGFCVFGGKCAMKEEGGCLYFDQLKRARSAKIVITNYAYFMSQCEFSDGIGPFTMLVLDEAHASPDHVIGHIGVRFSRNNRIESRALGLRDALPNTAHGWESWAEDKLGDVVLSKNIAKDGRKEKTFLQLKRTEEKLKRVLHIDKSWLWEDDDDGVSLSPIWPAPFTESVLFLGIPKVVLTSATVVRKTAQLMGIEGDDLTLEEYPHSFPLDNRRLIHVPTVRMNYKIGKLEQRQWINRVDQIIRDRTHYKGIIHTVSYARRDQVIAGSRYRDMMITHNKKDTEEVVRRFKEATEPLILVSPSMATGWDFPGDECRYQIIVKLPYPDTRGNIVKSRSKADSDYTAYVVMQQLIQACGRGVRTDEDWCETFVTDDNIAWFVKKFNHLSVEWFVGAFMRSATVPRPLK